MKYEVKSSKGAYLGMITFYSAWRKYCFHPAAATIFDQSCLTDLSEMLVVINRQHREERTKHET